MLHKPLASACLLFCALALFLSACAAPTVTSSPASPTPPAATLKGADSTATPAGPFPNYYSDLVDVGSYKLQLECMGTGTPAIILDSGLGTMKSNWIGIMAKLSNTTRVCAYNRAGIDQSDPAPKPRTSQVMADDLHHLLANAGVPGPYLLVGASIASFNVILYANSYPGEVTGLVLIDGSHPDQYTQSLAAFPTPAPTEDPNLASMRRGLTNLDPLLNPEGFDFLASADQVRAVKSLGSLPLLVLSRHPLTTIKGLDSVEVASMEQVWSDLQDQLAALSTKSTHLIADQGGHNIQIDDPQFVIDSILKMLGKSTN